MPAFERDLLLRGLARELGGEEGSSASEEDSGDPFSVVPEELKGL